MLFRSRIDGDLAGALEGARGLTSVIEAQVAAGRGVLRAFESEGEPAPSPGATDAALGAEIEAIRFEVGALRARTGRTDVTSMRSSESARAGGEGS